MTPAGERALESWGHERRGRSPSAERNRGPILEVLEEVLPPRAQVLEIASGTGQHVVHFARRLPSTQWQPSDPDPQARDSIQAWIESLRAEAHLTNVEPPLDIDACSKDWKLGNRQFDALVNINMIHISPWDACRGLFHGAGRHVRDGGLVVLYGPFRRAGVETAPSNEVFDESLRARDPRWGVRDLDRVSKVAHPSWFRLEKIVAMPANNLVVVYRRSETTLVMPLPAGS